MSKIIDQAFESLDPERDKIVVNLINYIEMKTIKTIHDDPVLEMTTITFKGEEVPAALHYDHEYGLYKSNLKFHTLDEVEYDEAMRRRVLRDLILSYSGKILERKIEEFDLLKLKSDE